MRCSRLRGDRAGRVRRLRPARRGDRAAFLAQLAPTLPLARHIFRSPTQYYKTGIVFLAYLNGYQDHSHMLGAQEGARSTLHLAEAFRLADQAGLLLDPVRAAAR